MAMTSRWPVAKLTTDIVRVAHLVGLVGMTKASERYFHGIAQLSENG